MPTFMWEIWVMARGCHHGFLSQETEIQSCIALAIQRTPQCITEGPIHSMKSIHAIRSMRSRAVLHMKSGCDRLAVFMIRNYSKFSLWMHIWDTVTILMSIWITGISIFCLVLVCHSFTTTLSECNAIIHYSFSDKCYVLCCRICQHG